MVGDKGGCFNDKTPEKGLISVPVVVYGGEEDYLWRRGMPQSVGGNFNDDNTLKWADKCS